MKCKNCGKYILDNSKECEFCGTPQEDNKPVEPIEPVVEQKVPEQKKEKINWFNLIIGIGIAIIIFVIIICFMNTCSYRKTSNGVANSYKNATTETVAKEESNVEVTTEEQTTKAPTTVEPTTEKPTEQQTEDPKVLEENFKKYCNTIDFKTLARNPDKYKGNWYKFTGKVIQVIEYSWSDTVELRVDVTKEEFEYSDDVYWSDTIYAIVKIPDGEDRILEDDIITFWGVCDGMYTYESVLGSSVSLPKIDIEYYVLGEQ